MFVKKSIWLIFYSLLLIGLAYLILSIILSWNTIKEKSAEELSYLNRIFSSSVTSTFDQQEIMLELLGQQLIHNKHYQHLEKSSHILDKLLLQNTSLVGFGLSNLDGQLVAASSNVDLTKMPNLKQSNNSKLSFMRAMNSQKMVLGTTYYLEALENWVIPIRKAIRDNNDELIGVMTAGIKPKELLPKLYALNTNNSFNQYQFMLIHDDSFHYAYISGVKDTNQIKDIINNPIPDQLIELLEESIRDQLNISLDDIRKQKSSVQFFAPSLDQELKMFSYSYLPDYKVWSIASVPKSRLLAQLKSTFIQYTATFIFVFSIIYLLFIYIHKFEQNNRQKLINQANKDFLTGLSNRLYLKHIEPDWIHDNAKAFSVLFMDLDNFKNINDSYGHSYGDRILKQVAIRLLSIFSEKSLVCRQGGDEFIILCKKTSQKNLDEIASTVLDTISRPYELDNYLFTIGASIGICRYPSDGGNFDSLFSAADTAMYRAKNSQHNYFIFTNELKQQINQTSEIEQAIHSALQNNEFHMVYQPQVASKGSLYGVEALIRWNNEKLGMIPPDQFIPVAEDSGLILELGHFIIDQSIKDIAELSKNNDHFNLQLSINISVRQFMEFGFLENLKSSLLIHKFPSSQLTLEITESIFIEDFEYMAPLFNEIRALGIKISLDDFGTGFSSLSMLRKLPIDELKIDKSFIDQSAHNKLDKAMVINILNIARNFNLKVVAEGIETQQQAGFLAEHRCGILQGYFYSRPVQFNELELYCSGFKKPAV